MEIIARRDYSAIEVMCPEDERARPIGKPARSDLRGWLEDFRASELVQARSERPAQAIARGSMRKRKCRPSQKCQAQRVKAKMQDLILLLRRPDASPAAGLEPWN